MSMATYPVEVSVNYSLTVHVNQPLGDVRKLRQLFKRECKEKV